MSDRPGTSRVLYRNQKREFPVITHGEGVYLYDDTGKRYIDALGGVAVVNIGHGVPEILVAIEKQFEKVCFVHGGAFTSTAQIELADHVVALAPEGITSAFFVSGGAEATETALKLARQYWVETGRPDKHKVISRWGSYHGNTVGAMSMSGRKDWIDMYQPYLLDFPHIEPAAPYGCAHCKNTCTLQCAQELEDVIEATGADTVSAFIADPFVGSTIAAAAAPPGYFEAVREICDRHDVLFIADEVLTGFGRTGRNFGIDHWGVSPDMIACGKGIASGYVPLGACLISDRIASAIRGGTGKITHGFTYGGNPLSSAIGLAVQEYIHDHELIARSADLGGYLFEQAQHLRELPIVGEIRGGKGLFLGIEFVEDQKGNKPFPRSLGFGEMLQEVALELGMTTMAGTGGAHGQSGDNMMLAPPFIVTRGQIDEIIELTGRAIEESASRCGI